MLNEMKHGKGVTLFENGTVFDGTYEENKRK